MLKALGWVIKLALFSIVVLLAGDWIHWHGRTLSQHVRAQLTQVEHTDAAGYVRGLTRRITDDARAGFEKKIKQQHPRPSVAGSNSQAQQQPVEITDRMESQAAAPALETHASKAELQAARTDEQLPPSERQKLRALIRELNSSH